MIEVNPCLWGLFGVSPRGRPWPLGSSFVYSSLGHDRWVVGELRGQEFPSDPYQQGLMLLWLKRQKDSYIIGFAGWSPLA